jgi:hypothetical protein
MAINDLKNLVGLAPEHFHPLLVHFPLALWLVGTLLFIAALLPAAAWLELPAIIIGVIGSLFGWATKEAGETAAEIVGPKLCNMKGLVDHAHLAETAFTFFVVCWGLATLSYWGRSKVFKGRRAPVWISGIVAVGLVLGSVFLVLAGHAGFQLVYFGGAAVKAPLTRCSNLR